MARREPTGKGYSHDSVEFGRVVAFSDGLFAIAMTLLVIGITVPALSDGESISELADDLGELQSNVISFFISFAVIGRYWVAHHQFFSQLRVVDNGLIGINLVYLGFIAFLPFPTALLGTYFENPLAVSIYAISVGVVSGLEVVLFRHAHRNGLLRRRLPDDVYRWSVSVSLSPLLFFGLSIPLAFLSTTAAALFWLGTIPFGILADRRKPEGTDELLGSG